MDTCPGKIDIGGYGPAEIVATQYNVKDDAAGKVYVENGKVVPHYRARGYFADACTAGEFNHSQYVALPLLGQALTFTTDLSSTGCGCNVAMYLTQLQQNPEISDCGDYYCDANTVCGVRCHEIDIMEANAHAFRVSLHTEDDAWGMTKGIGGEAVDWRTEDYGLQGKCVNTSSPFQVTAGFPMDAYGILEAMVITLSQVGMPCNLSVRLTGYDGNSTITSPPFSGTAEVGSNHGMRALGDALREGMTPIVSLWGADSMSWMDGKGSSGNGPCEADADSEDNCPEQIEMYDFRVEALPPAPPFWSTFRVMAILGVCVFFLLVVGLVWMLRGEVPEEASSVELLEEETTDSN